jgi:hypothetical protein
MQSDIILTSNHIEIKSRTDIIPTPPDNEVRLDTDYISDTNLAY